MLEELATLNNT